MRGLELTSDLVVGFEYIAIRTICKSRARAGSFCLAAGRLQGVLDLWLLLLHIGLRCHLLLLEESCEPILQRLINESIC